MKELELNIQDIKELMEALHRNKLSCLKIRQGEFSLELTHETAEPVLLPGAAVPASAYAGAASQEPDEPTYCGEVVTSPIVGTFYASPGPDQEAFVHVGSRVKKGDILFIIESMKLMNEVTSDVDGVVTDILVENAQGVEFGQPILVIA